MAASALRRNLLSGPAPTKYLLSAIIFWERSLRLLIYSRTGSSTSRATRIQRVTVMRFDDELPRASM
eukprot:13173407-Alexandrium_andersonii.AAC.1